MDPQERDDREIRELFARVREADRAALPGFEATVRSGKRRPQRRTRVGFAAALGTAAGLALAVSAWFTLQVPTLERDQPAMSQVAPSVVPPTPVPMAQVRPPVPSGAPAKPRTERESDKRGDIVAKVPSPPPPLPARQGIDAKELRSLGYVAAGQGAADAGPMYAATSPRTADKAELKDEPVQDLPVAGRVYEQALTVMPEAPAGVAGTRSGLLGQARANGSFAKLQRVVSKPEMEIEPGFNTETYAPIRSNEFLSARENPLSTFSIDVDTASYANVRRFLKGGQLPPRDAVRVEELINYFRYDYPPPAGDAPFSASVEVAACPWNEAHRLARIGLKGRDVVRGESGGSNLVFLIDVSGSMDSPEKLPLLKAALGLLANELDGKDEVAMVVYAGSSGLVLPPTRGNAKSEIQGALDRLQAGGSTNGGEGLRLAYRLAREHFIRGGINRVILATDGDFNVGVTSQGELLRLVEDDARQGIFLTVLGFGMGNYKDATLELLADRGNGNYAYIDDLREARKVLVEEIGGTLVTIAKDVKIQVEFNPAEVESYRLVGYENRMLRKEDFNDDRKDAGEIGAGHTVTALYEIVPAGTETEATPPVDPLKYQTPGAKSEAAGSGELLTLKLRYKDPDGDKSRLLSFPIADAGRGLEQASADFKFAAAVAQFGFLLRDGAQAKRDGFDRVRSLAQEGAGKDDGGYRAEFLALIQRASELSRP